MGMDKEATDIWLFGRPRPDLTPKETFDEARKRREAMNAHSERRVKELLGENVSNIIEQARKLA